MEGERCVFPFIWKGQKYSKCTYTDSPTPWCPTMLNSDGTVVSNRFGDCSTTSSCDIEPIKFSSCITQGGPFSNKPCLFPFRFNGVTYSSCTTDTLGKPWCSTAQDATGTHINGQYGLCPSSCPGVKQNLGEDPGECIPGSTWSKECNTCVCTSTGRAVCTLERCPALCSAVSGPATGRECVFPFTWDGKTYQGCTPWTYGGSNQGKMWCSTRTDGQGGHVNGGGNFGYCGPECPAAGTDLIKIKTRTEQVPNDAIVFGENPNPNTAPN
eukprot:GFUD01064474.1.p1 GENE.GFUD01064474.1~~GFUD01064474.1.p1  ORF type:complete len:306 (+),score=62.46 GFUD01064474.1:112-918(+)